MGKRALEERNLGLIDPFARWLQQVQFKTPLLRVKSQFTSPKTNYVLLTDMGQKAKKTEPVRIWAKVQKVTEDTVGIEVVDSTVGTRYVLRCSSDDLVTVQSVLKMDDPVLQAMGLEKEHIETRGMLSMSFRYRFVEDGVIRDTISERMPCEPARSATSSTEGEDEDTGDTGDDEDDEDEETVVLLRDDTDTQHSHSEGVACNSRPLPTIQTESPSIQNEPTRSDDNNKNSTNTNGTNASNAMPASEPTDHSLRLSNDQLQQRLVTSMGEIQALQLQLIVLRYCLEDQRIRGSQNDTHNQSEQPQGSGSFSIQNFVLRKIISKTSNGILYAVEHARTGGCYTIKEIGSQIGAIDADYRGQALGRELKVLMDLRNSGNTSPNLLQTYDIIFEPTPLRNTCYILSQPVALSFEEFLDTIREHIRPENTQLFATAAYQVLSGLNFFLAHTGCIHGNLGLNNILISTDNQMLISSFDHAVARDKLMHYSLFLDDQRNLKYKHSCILEARRSDSLVVSGVNLDIYSLGLILYRLLSHNDLYEDSDDLQQRFGKRLTPRPTEMLVSFFMNFNTYDNILAWPWMNAHKAPTLGEALQNMTGNQGTV
ncbi:unnamed protein product [Cyberlindnera jadinii]|uniref:mitogen-activated protein kinase kinase n=1 Tax=Cyberlindnera jadinii (strain ATCC 18201 / CBS 1600 / BCRC 20928 / JCM 3617 / NBRC 0987 / NRRL Y-1542) TaxID=983966 RepID=A0A0H5C7A8_CYBJN|nr:unnamed protein product [Cyberlindnera jadinii]